MGRKNKYETHVKPFLNDIPKWYESMTEGQIAKKLGIATSTFESYKLKYSELAERLSRGKEFLIDDLKSNLKMKAQGFKYTETKTIKALDEDTGELVVVQIIEQEKYAQPDTGAIHLLLKNLDPAWHNDDQETINIKRKQLEIAEKKAQGDDW